MTPDGGLLSIFSPVFACAQDAGERNVNGQPKSIFGAALRSDQLQIRWRQQTIAGQIIKIRRTVKKAARVLVESNEG